jgi:hypothetical protein
MIGLQVGDENSVPHMGKHKQNIVTGELVYGTHKMEVAVDTSYRLVYR